MTMTDKDVQETKSKKQKKKRKIPRDFLIAQRVIKTLGVDATEAVLLRRLIKDLSSATSMVGIREIRYLVDAYYSLQKARVSFDSQVGAREEDEPMTLLEFLSGNVDFLEKTLQVALGDFAVQYRVGQWLQSICGIGKVLSAGLLVTFDPRRLFVITETKSGKRSDGFIPEVGKIKTQINKGKLSVVNRRIEPRYTAGKFWSFAGYNPEAEWKRGSKRPWSARAKVLGYKVGDQFIKNQNNEKDVYGQLYVKFKEVEKKKNDAGLLADQARRKLEKYKIGKDTDAYKAYSIGKLPDAHITARARRKAVKLFLAHLHRVMFVDYWGQEPPVPYVFSDKFTGGVHTHFIEPPMFDGFDGMGLRELYGDNGEDESTTIVLPGQGEIYPE
jgi:hypothetical protein